MKKVMLVVAVLAVALISAPAWASSVVGSPHDLSTRLGTGEVCLSCHAPHNAIEPEAGPIWNHALNSTGFTKDGAPLTLYSNSLLCMGCHDGVTAVGNFNIVNSAITENSQGTLALGSMTGANAANVIGTDLTATHPVGVTYRQLGGSDSTSFHAAVQSTGSSGTISYKIGGVLRLEAGKTAGTNDTVGCSTCHNPHDNSKGLFLRVSNVGSALCLTCHIH